MKLIWILAGAALFLCLPVLLTAYICYRIAFFAPARKPPARPSN